MTSTPGLPAVETEHLGKRFGSFWALRDCTIRIPTGKISALVGPNGAGKSTLLRLLMGLASPSAGEVRVLGRVPEQRTEFLRSVGYLAQELPLYRKLSAADHLALGAHLNARWDGHGARERLEELDIPLDQKVGTLSGGQRSQVALALTLAKRPNLLLLDEPVAALDPLARHQFLATLAGAVSSGGLSVILSSHLLRDLEPVCDHLVLLAASRAQLCGTVERVIGTHRLLVGPRQNTSRLERQVTVVAATHTSRQSKLLVRGDRPCQIEAVVDPSWEARAPGLEEIALAYMKDDETGAAGPLIAMKGVS